MADVDTLLAAAKDAGTAGGILTLLFFIYKGMKEFHSIVEYILRIFDVLLRVPSADALLATTRNERPMPSLGCLACCTRRRRGGLMQSKQVWDNIVGNLLSDIEVSNETKAWQMTDAMKRRQKTLCEILSLFRGHKLVLQGHKYTDLVDAVVARLMPDALEAMLEALPRQCWLFGDGGVGFHILDRLRVAFSESFQRAYTKDQKDAVHKNAVTIIRSLRKASWPMYFTNTATNEVVKVEESNVEQLNEDAMGLTQAERAELITILKEGFKSDPQVSVKHSKSRLLWF